MLGDKIRKIIENVLYKETISYKVGREGLKELYEMEEKLEFSELLRRELNVKIERLSKENQQLKNRVDELEEGIKEGLKIILDGVELAEKLEKQNEQLEQELKIFKHECSVNHEKLIRSEKLRKYLADKLFVTDTQSYEWYEKCMELYEEIEKLKKEVNNEY